MSQSFPHASLEELKSRLNIVDVVGRVVPLRRAGANFKACVRFITKRRRLLLFRNRNKSLPVSDAGPAEMRLNSPSVTIIWSFRKPSRSLRRRTVLPSAFIKAAEIAKNTMRSTKRLRDSFIGLSPNRRMRAIPI